MPEADTPLPIPTAVAVELVLPVFESPPSVEREPDAESAGVDPPRSVLALFAVEMAVEKRPDVVSGLLEITDADAETLWLADTRELTVENDGDTDALGTKDAAALLFDDDAEAETDGKAEIEGTPPVFPNDAGAEVTALELLRVTECEKPALALSAPKAAETVETAELGAASVEVSEALVVEKVDCAALMPALALCGPVRRLVLELDGPGDALALASLVVVVFAPAKEAEADADAVTDSVPVVPLPPRVDRTTSVAVFSKLTLKLALACAAEDDFSGARVEVEDVGVGVVDELVVLVSDERVLALALPSTRAVLAGPDSLDWSITSVEEEVAAAVVIPPAALDIPVLVSVSAPVFDTVAVTEGTRADVLLRSKPRYTQSILNRRETKT